MTKVRATWTERSNNLYAERGADSREDDTVRTGIIVGYINVERGIGFETRAVIMEIDKLVTVPIRVLVVEEE